MARRKPERIADADIVKTFRVILATMVQQYGTLNMVVLTRRELEAAGAGTLSVSDRPDGSIVLRVKGAPIVTIADR